jgi:hypothetical protein
MDYFKNYAVEFEDELAKPVNIGNDIEENYITAIEQCMLSIKLNKKIIEVHSTGEFNLNKIIVREARESIKQMQEAIQIFSSKIT